MPIEIVNDLKMSTITDDPVDRLLDAAQSGKTLIKNRDVLHFTHMPEQILHRDPEQEKLTQSLLPILMNSRPSNLLAVSYTHLTLPTILLV